MTSFNSSLEKLLVQAAEAVRPATRMSVSEAAERFRYINMPGSYVGPWKNATTPYLVEPMDTLTSLDFTGMIFVGPAQTGKALALDTRLPTPSGWTTMGEATIGDWLLAPSGKPVKVTAVSPVQHGRNCFRVVFDDGSEIVADEDHRWTVQTIDGANRTLTTGDMLREGLMRGQRRKFRIPNTEPLELPDQDLLLDPYILGLWIGDGNTRNAYLSVGRSDLEEIMAQIEVRGYSGKVYQPSAVHRCYAVALRGPDGVPVDQYLSTLGLGGDFGKDIPDQYLRASREQRMELLRGLLDTDGYAGGKNGHTIQFVQAKRELAERLVDLVCGLGFKPRVTFREPAKESHSGSYSVTFTVGDEQVFSFPRKQAAVQPDAKLRLGETKVRFVRDIIPVESVPVKCVAVDSEDRLYLAGERMVPTHNTDMVLNWLLHSVKNDPADMMVVQTSRTTARDFSMRRVDRLHRNNAEALAGMVGKDNTFDVHYLSGMLLTLSWPAINELSGKPIPRLWLTDYDRMPQNIDDEGSPFDLARKRATSFRRYGMTVAESSPGFMVDKPKWVRKSKHEAEPTQGILALYNRGDRRRWYWKCVECHNAFEPDFELLVYPDSDDIMEAAEMAKLRCPHCDAEYIHEGGNGRPSKHEMNQTGRWVRDNQVWTPEGDIVGIPPRSNIASFWLKGAAAAFQDWKGLVFNYLNAEQEYASTGSEEALKTTVNTDQGKPYTPKQMASDRVPEQLKSRAKPLGLRVVPHDVRFLLACVDVQKNRFVVQVHGIAANGDIYIIDRFDIRKSMRKDVDGERFWVNPGAHPEDWKLLTSEVMLKTYPLSDGSDREMAIKFTVCDSGGKDGVTANAYEFFRWLRRGDDDEVDTGGEEGTYEWSPELAGRFLLLKGASSPNAPRFAINFPDSMRKDRHAGARGEIPVGFINVNLLKDTLNNKLDRVEPGGRIVFPDWLPDNFYIELTVEVRDAAKGWLNPKQYRNESWDLLTYCHAAFLVPGVAFEQIDFSDPPGWAEEWDHNDLVFDTTTSAKPFDAEEKPAYSLAKLASSLA